MRKDGVKLQRRTSSRCLQYETRMHSSGMRTARPLTVVPVMITAGLMSGGGGEVNDLSHPGGEVVDL